MNDIANEVAPNAFAENLQKVRDAIQVLNDNEGDIAELLDPELGIEAHVIGQLLMIALPIPEMAERLLPAQKAFWMQVADHMGPDWIGELRRVAAFMDKVNQF